MNIKYTTKLDTNGNRKARILITDLENEYNKFLDNTKSTVSNQLGFDAVINKLKNLGYRYNKAGKEPNLTCFFETEEELKAEIMDSFVFAASNGVISISRYRYMNGNRRATHKDYYSQFITSGLRSYAVRESENILKCKKKHLNDHYSTKAEANNYKSSDFVRLIALANATTRSSYSAAFSSSDVTCALKAALNERLVTLIRDLKKSKTTEVDAGIFVTEHYNGYHLSYKGETLSCNEAFQVWIKVSPYRRSENIQNFKNSIKEALYLPENQNLCA